MTRIQNPVFLKHAYIPNKPTTFSTTCCSQSWLIAGNPSACSESVCQPIVFTTASQMGEWLRRNSNSLEGCKPLLPSPLPAGLPASTPSSPKWSPCRKQAHQCHLANCLHVGRKGQKAAAHNWACLSAPPGTLPCPSKNRGAESKGLQLQPRWTWASEKRSRVTLQSGRGWGEWEGDQAGD